MNSPRGSTDSAQKLKVPALNVERMSSILKTHSRERSSSKLEENVDLPENVHDEVIVARGISIEEKDDLKELRTKNEELQ